MSINCYLAMTAAEFSSAKDLPPHLGWMACHFSCYGTGLSNFPTTLPEGSIVIVNDCTPISGHDPQQIARELSSLAEKHSACAVLLDFQRPDCAQAASLVKTLITALPCPVGVSDCYGKDLSCPVFLPPPSLHTPLKAYLAPWSGREIWLDAALGYEEITVTAKGSQIQSQLPIDFPDTSFEDTRLHCRYNIAVNDDSAVFSLVRDKVCLDTLLQEAETLGVTLAVGLYQQLK